jgi:hypothetical protein
VPVATEYEDLQAQRQAGVISHAVCIGPRVSYALWPWLNKRVGYTRSGGLMPRQRPAKRDAIARSVQGPHTPACSRPLAPWRGRC